MNISHIVDSNRGRTATCEKRKQIVDEFAAIINKYSLENDSNTPDFIIAEFLFECLLGYQLAVTKRILWFKPGDYKGVNK